MDVVRGPGGFHFPSMYNDDIRRWTLGPPSGHRGTHLEWVSKAREVCLCEIKFRQVSEFGTLGHPWDPLGTNLEWASGSEPVRSGFLRPAGAPFAASATGVMSLGRWAPLGLLWGPCGMVFQGQRGWLFRDQMQPG